MYCYSQPQEGKPTLNRLNVSWAAASKTIEKWTKQKQKNKNDVPKSAQLIINYKSLTWTKGIMGTTNWGDCSHQWTVVIISKINASRISKGLYFAKGVTMSCSVPCLFPLWLCLAWLHIPCRPSSIQPGSGFNGQKDSVLTVWFHTHTKTWVSEVSTSDFSNTWKVKRFNSSVSVYIYIYTCNIVSFHNNPLRHISVSLIHVEQISVQCCSGTVSTNIHSRNHPLHQRWCDLNKSRRIQPGGFGADQECMAYTLHYAHLSAAIIQTFKKNIYIYICICMKYSMYIYIYMYGIVDIYVYISTYHVDIQVKMTCFTS